MPAIAAVRAARGPEQFTTVPHVTTSPEASVTLSTLEPSRGFGHRDHFVRQVLNTAFTGRAFPPVKQGVAVKITLVDQVVVAHQDVVEIIKRVIRFDFLSGHVLGTSPQFGLNFLTLF